MKPFESCLAPKLEEYLAYRVGLGYSDGHRRLLRHFDCYIQERLSRIQWERFTTDFFIDFSIKLHHAPRTVNGIISAVRCFFAYQVRLGRIQDNPLTHLPARKELAYIPFIFSPEQTEQLLESVQGQIRHDDEQHFLLDLGIHLALQLIADLGLRITEPLRLRHCHYRPNEATLYIERTKFHKDRLIPIPRRTKTTLDNYLATRQALAEDDDNPFLITGHQDRGLHQQPIYNAFHRALDECGIEKPRRIIGNTIFSAPIVHSMRHAFAVNTLKRIKLKGKSPQNALPVLAAFMGHRYYRYTAKYLKLIDAEQHGALVDFAVRSNGLK